MVHDLDMRQDISAVLCGVGRSECQEKVSFPFSMVVLNRFLSQAKAYLDEDDHHKVTEERYIIVLSGSES